MEKNAFSLMIMVLLTTVGCFPGVRITKDPGPKDTGIRYYRPKPYLLLQPVAEGKDNDQHVAISLEYLPDYTEEYSINVRPGLGSANVSVKLDDGWNLTSLNQELDTQTDEIIGAVGGVLGNAAKLAAGGGGGEGRFIVQASNVPLGYYEAVLGRDACGVKRLYGWRYVGFLPYQLCPLDACGGGDTIHCHTQPSPIFGLVFEGGTLTFKSIGEIQASPSVLQGVMPPDQPAMPERLPPIAETVAQVTGRAVGGVSPSGSKSW